MVKYIFFLGRKPLISLAELAALLPPETNYIRLQNEMLLAETVELKNPQLFLNRLGGTTKIVQITSDNIAGPLPKVISETALAKFQGREDKVRYAIAVYNLEGPDERMMKNSLLETKKKLKAAKLSSRFINNNFHLAPTALLLGERILEKGAEFNAIQMERDWMIGETIGIQDIDAYSKRDYERPERDPRLGMLPPKLAQIMINLAQAQPGQTIYDPFCGIGTILMEGILMGIDVVGSDLAIENVSKARTNLEWLYKDYPHKATMRLFSKDATKVTQSDLPETIAAVVSETFLGPPVSRTPSPDQIESNQMMVGGLIANFLRNVYPLLPMGAHVVLTLLTYRHGKQYLTMDRLHREFDGLGYEEMRLIPEELISKLNLDEEAEESLVYERPDQTVCREIVKLKKI